MSFPLRILWLLLCCLTLTACSPHAVPDVDFRQTQPLGAPDKLHTSDKILRIAVISSLSPAETAAHFRRIADYLGQATGRQAVLIPRRNYLEVSVLLRNGGTDLAFFPAGAFGAYPSLDDMHVIAAQERMGSSLYNAVILVHRDSPCQTLSDLKGSTVAFSDPMSYSGYVYLARRLQELGQTPESFFSHSVYTYGHEKSLHAVANRSVQCASVSTLAYNHARQNYPEVADAVRIIETSPAMGTGPVVVRRSMPPEERQQLQELFLRLHEQPELKEALKGLLIDRFVPPSEEWYSSFRQAFGRREALP